MRKRRKNVNLGDKKSQTGEKKSQSSEININLSGKKY